MDVAWRRGPIHRRSGRTPARIKMSKYETSQCEISCVSSSCLGASMAASAVFLGVPRTADPRAASWPQAIKPYGINAAHLPIPGGIACYLLFHHVIEHYFSSQ